VHGDAIVPDGGRADTERGQELIMRLQRRVENWSSAGALQASPVRCRRHQAQHFGGLQ
jgi:hypothetical protein